MHCGAVLGAPAKPLYSAARTDSEGKGLANHTFLEPNLLAGHANRTFNERPFLNSSPQSLKQIRRITNRCRSFTRYYEQDGQTPNILLTHVILVD